MITTKVFISHASEDKVRFVLHFAEKLRAKGIDAWLDKWEMLPGDSLVDKIFEEGIKNADAIIVILSQNSVNKKWVKEELNAAFVKRINEGSKLIPIILDECVVPQALHSTVWQKINDLKNYKEEFDRIIMAIVGSTEKPSLGKSPSFTRVVTDILPGLNKIDTIIFNKACEKYLREITTMNSRISSDDLFDNLKDFEIPREEFFDSLEILDRNSYIKITKVMSGHIPFFNISHFGLDKFLRLNIEDYDKLYHEICHIIVNSKFPGDHELADSLNISPIIVMHILDDLKNKNLIKSERAMGGTHILFGITAELKRMLRE